MKIIFIVMALFCMCGCGSEAYDEQALKCSNSISFMKMEKFEYQGHQYIRFKTPFAYGDNVLHDPDCPCHKQMEVR